MLISLLRRQPVDGYEMPQQLCPPRVAAGKKDVLDVMAVLAQGLEAAQPLAACLLVVPPALVAVQPALPAAGLAAVSGPLIDGPAYAVPLRRRQEIGQAGQFRIFRDRFDAQSQANHARVFGVTRL